MRKESGKAVYALPEKSVVAKHFPPHQPNDENHHHVKGHNAGVDFVKPGPFEIALGEINRAGTAAVFGISPHQVAKNAKADGDHHRRRARSDGCRGKGGVQRCGGNRRGSRKLVNVNIENTQNHKGFHSAKALNTAAQQRRHPLDKP